MSQTLQEMLDAWDRGDTIWSISMGGLGPGYEQAIQVAAVEFARAAKEMQWTYDAQTDARKFDALCDAALKSIDAELGGLTGAMYGAARWLAWQWCREEGPDGLVARAKDRDLAERLIQVSNRWPKVGSSTTGTPQ